MFGKRVYRLHLPEILHKEIEQAIEQNGSKLTVEEFLRKCVKTGLLLSKLSQKPDTAVLIQEGERTRELDFYGTSETE